MKAATFPPEESWILYPDAAPEAIEAKAPFVDNGSSLITPERYYDPAFMAREWDHMWTRTWLLAGRESDLPAVGSFFTFDIGPESIIVVRATPNEIKAFYNVCQHRGNRLVRTPCGHAAQLRCPFHGWTWNVDGSLQSITDEETFRAEVVRDRPGLQALRCETWGGFVFVNMDQHAAPLSEQLGVLPRHLAPYGFEHMAVAKEVTVEVAANWKTGIDAFMEGYHVHCVHPQGLMFMDEYHAQWDLYDHGIGRIIFPVSMNSPRVNDPGEMNDYLRFMLAEVGIEAAGFAGNAHDVRAAIQHRKRELAEKFALDFSGLIDDQLTDDWNYNIFPNITLNIHAEGVLVMRFRPHERDPERFYYDIIVLHHKVADPDYLLPAYMGVAPGTDLSGNTRPAREIVSADDASLGDVLLQDMAMIPYVQRGLHSRGYNGARLSAQEQRMRHFHAELERYLDVTVSGRS